MAKKKRKSGRTAAQRAATRRLLAFNRARRRGANPKRARRARARGAARKSNGPRHRSVRQHTMHIPNPQVARAVAKALRKMGLKVNHVMRGARRAARH